MADQGLPEFTVADIVEISYATKVTARNDAFSNEVDFFLLIYTEPREGGAASWYGDRLTAEPMYMPDYDSGNDWKVLSTSSLVFYDGNRTYLGFYDGAPTLADIQFADDEYTWPPSSGCTTDCTVDYANQTVKAISIQTASDWFSGFDGYLDTIAIELKDGTSVTLDLEGWNDVWVDGNWSGSSFGVEVGDNKFFGHNAFASIQEAIDSVAKGGTVHVAAGTYGESPRMTVPLRLVGPAGGTAVIEGTLLVDHAKYSGPVPTLIDGIDFKVTGDGAHSISLQGVDGIVISNCAFDGDGRFVDGAANAVSLERVPRLNNVTIENCTFSNGYYVAINGYADNLTVRDSTITNVKSGINLQGGGNLIVENTKIEVVAQGQSSDTYCVRFASSGSGTGNGMHLLGGAYGVDKRGITADEGTYHSAIILREGAGGTLQANQLSLAGDVVNLSSSVLDATYNWWGQATGPAAGQVTDKVLYDPWLGKAPSARSFPTGAALVVDAIPESVVADQTFDTSVYVVPGTDEVFGFEFTLDVPTGLTLVSVQPGAFLARMDELETNGDPADTGGYTWSEQGHNLWITFVDDEYNSAPGIVGAPAEVAKLTFTADGHIGCGKMANIGFIANSAIFADKEGARSEPALHGDSVAIYAPVNASGVVELQGRTDHSGATVMLTGVGEPPFGYLATVTNSGGSWEKDVACGTYIVTADMNAYLDAVRNNAVVQEAYDAGTVKLLGGNADEGVSPHSIVLGDVVAIANVIGSTPAPDLSAEGKYPDINADGTINILDLVLAGINYTEEGPKSF